jgi:signal transduction histidine kinase
MVRYWFYQIWQKPSGKGFPATLARRTLIILWSVVLLMFILVAPAFLAVHLDHELRMSHSFGSVLDRLIRAHADRHTETASVLPFTLAHRHGIGAIYVSQNEADPTSYFLLGDTTDVLARTDATYDLDRPIWMRNGLTAMTVLFAANDQFIRVVGVPAEDGRQLDVFVSEKHIRADVWALFVKGGILVLAALIASHFLLRWAIYQSVARSFTGLVAGLYGKQSGSARSDAFNQMLVDNHLSIEKHIAEQARLASLGSAASRLAHDVRNLLASLRLIAERFAGMEDEKSQKLGQRMEANIDRALMLCDWATRYKRDKREDMTVAAHRLGPIVDEALSFVKLHDPRDRVELVNLVDADISFVGERTLIFRILYNVFLNAVQAMQAHKSGRGYINVSAEKVDQMIHIDIVDGGPGMSEEQAQQVRDICAGHQVGVQSSAVGLGILIAADLTRWHGGALSLERCDSMGTIFRLSLPVAGPQRELPVLAADAV